MNLAKERFNKFINYNLGVVATKLTMKKKILHDISANSLQVIINQLSGLVIFYILSAYLTKNDFGEINWSLAVLLTIFNMLPFGIDQLVIKKIATGNNISPTFSAYNMHVLLSGLLVFVLLLAGNLFFTKFFHAHQILLLLSIGKLMIFFSSPFKQLALGMEKFKPLLYMSVFSNILRVIALLIFTFLNVLSLKIIIIIFISGDLAELLLCLFITKYQLKFPLKQHWDKNKYLELFKESLPQMGVVVFNAAVARLDWIFLGILASNIVLANYSFAYKVFEAATLPLLIIAPLLIPRFSKLFQHDHSIAKDKQNSLLILLRFEIIVACGVALVLNILWVPCIDFITNNKYGAVNKFTILILSASMPFLYFNNFLWTMNFAQGHLKKIFYITFIFFIINLIATVVLIPFFNGEGAAVAYLISIIIQAAFFFMQSGFTKYSKNMLGILLVPVYAIAGGILANLLFTNTWLILFAAILMYLVCSLLAKQIQWSDWQMLTRQSNFKKAT